MTPSAPQSTAQSSPLSTAEETQIEVIKSAQQSLTDLLSGGAGLGRDGEINWPLDPHGLADLYRHSAEHARAIQVKSEAAFGGGLIGDRAEEIEELADAGSETGATDLFTSLGLDLATFGNAFLQKLFLEPGGEIIGLRRLPAVTMFRRQNGFLQRSAGPDGKVKKTLFRADEIVHLKEPCPFGRPYAFPTWIGAEGMLELAMAAVRYNSQFFKNHGIPEYAVVFKGTRATPDQRHALGEFFRGEFLGIDRSHRTMVMDIPEGADVEFKKLTGDVKDGDFLKLIDAARDRIQLAHGVPSRILGIMTAGQLGGGGEVTAQLFAFERMDLRPRRRRMLDQLRPFLKTLGLKPGNPDRGLGENEIAFAGLDLTPPKDETEQLSDLVDAGILSVGEARDALPAATQDESAPHGD